MASPIPVTVVIPVRNERSTIEPLLDAIASQVPLPQAVVVVDAGSTDGTPEVVRRRIADDARLQLIEVARAYPGEGRNLGSAAATTEWLVYIDGGTLPHPGWLHALWTGVQGTPAQAAYGFFVPALDTSVARWFALAALPGAKPVAGGLMRNHFIACSMVQKRAWERVGGFPPFRAAQDRIFMAAVDRGPFVEVPQAVITWIGPQTWRGLWHRTVLMGEHCARAGRAGLWHWPTARLWAVGVLIAALVPGLAKGALLALAVAGRTERRLRRHRWEPELARRRWGDRLGATAVLTVMDLALFVGWARRLWFWRDPGAGPIAGPMPGAGNDRAR